MAKKKSYIYYIIYVTINLRRLKSYQTSFLTIMIGKINYKKKTAKNINIKIAKNTPNMHVNNK